jgi:DNA-binding XRE family transcriptional regulator
MNSLEVLKIREEFGLTQQKFADFLGVDRRTIVNWEKGNKIPDSKIKLLELLVEGRRNGSEGNLLSSNPEIKHTPSVDPNREILELKDHIKTLKEFLDEKTTICDIYKNETTRLKNEIEELRGNTGG